MMFRRLAFLLLACCLLFLGGSLAQAQQIGGSGSIGISPTSGPPGTTINVNVGIANWPILTSASCTANGTNFFTLGDAISSGFSASYTVPAGASGTISIVCTISVTDNTELFDQQTLGASFTVTAPPAPATEEPAPPPDPQPQPGQCPDPDGDGVPGDETCGTDRCPFTSGRGDQFGGVNGADGCPVDSDGDGVLDGLDQCPFTAGPGTPNGCPADNPQPAPDPQPQPQDNPAPDPPPQDNEAPPTLAVLPDNNTCAVATVDFNFVDVLSNPAAGSNVITQLDPTFFYEPTGNVSNAEGTWFEVRGGYVLASDVRANAACNIPPQDNPQPSTEELVGDIDLSTALEACPDLVSNASTLPAHIQLDLLYGTYPDPCLYVENSLGDALFGAPQPPLPEDVTQTILEECPQVLPRLLSVMDTLRAINSNAWTLLNEVITPDNACDLATEIASGRVPEAFLARLTASAPLTVAAGVPGRISAIPPPTAPAMPQANDGASRNLISTVVAQCFAGTGRINPGSINSIIDFMTAMGLREDEFVGPNRENNCDMLSGILTHWQAIGEVSPETQAILDYYRNMCPNVTPVQITIAILVIHGADADIMAALRDGAIGCEIPPNWAFDYPDQAPIPQAVRGDETCESFYQFVVARGPDDSYSRAQFRMEEVYTWFHGPNACELLRALSRPQRYTYNWSPSDFQAPACYYSANAGFDRRPAMFVLGDYPDELVVNEYDSLWRWIQYLSVADPCSITDASRQLDSDGDGVPDNADVCDDEIGFAADGCPVDSDGDGIPDYADPDAPNNDASGGQTTDPNDLDGDGVENIGDLCPNEPGSPDADRPGCPPEDDDDDQGGGSAGNNQGGASGGNNDGGGSGSGSGGNNQGNNQGGGSGSDSDGSSDITCDWDGTTCETMIATRTCIEYVACVPEEFNVFTECEDFTTPETRQSCIVNTAAAPGCCQLTADFTLMAEAPFTPEEFEEAQAEQNNTISPPLIENFEVSEVVVSDNLRRTVGQDIRVNYLGPDRLEIVPGPNADPNAPLQVSPEQIERAIRDNGLGNPENITITPGPEEIIVSGLQPTEPAPPQTDQDGAPIVPQNNAPPANNTANATPQTRNRVSVPPSAPPATSSGVDVSSVTIPNTSAIRVSTAQTPEALNAAVENALETPPPVGTTGVFMATDGASSNIYVFDGSDTEQTSTPILDTVASNSFPALNSDGDLVAFIMEQNGSASLNLTRISQPAAFPLFSSTPELGIVPAPMAWMPDSMQLLATMTDANGQPGIYLVDLTDPRDVPIPQLLIGNASGASISPNGRHIAFERAETDGTINVYVASTANPQEQRAVTQQPSGQSCVDPAFAPDSLAIFLACGPEDARELNRYDTAGVNPISTSANNVTNPLPGPVAEFIALDDDGIIYYGTADGATLAPIVELPNLQASGLDWGNIAPSLGSN